MMDLKGIGRHMPRARHQRGHVTETGKRVKQWVGWYYVYQKQPDGTEKRVHKSEVLGQKAGMPKWKAHGKLQGIIDKANCGANVRPSPEYTLRWFWEERYRPMKEPGWKVSSRPKTVWFIEHHVIAPFAEVALGDIDKFFLQKHLNELAANFSKSVVMHFRMHIRAILQEASGPGVHCEEPSPEIGDARDAERMQPGALAG